MTDNNAHQNQLTGEDAQAIAAKILSEAHLLGTHGQGGEKRLKAIEECFAHAGHEVDMTNRPILQAVMDSKPGDKPAGPTSPGIKPKTPGMK